MKNHCEIFRHAIFIIGDVRPKFNMKIYIRDEYLQHEVPPVINSPVRKGLFAACIEHLEGIP